ECDLIINNISTKKYADKDWDSYRNHTIGFVFQSYNLISHQTVLTNVELALTISGISKTERKKRAIEALKEVGLGDHINKKPNQMSGGQMQRVAIARALVNNPDILLADEPTGALDSETSVQIMNLLQKVAEDRLVVMVTHNPELAYEYATRIINFKDGNIVDDTNPFTPDSSTTPKAEHKNLGKASMSFGTSLSLSFNNLKTKKGRTILTAFAGSIGIIGVSLILALSSGVNQYIEDVQKETMSSYPIIIDSTTFDLASIIESESSKMPKVDDTINKALFYADNTVLEAQENMKASVIDNNLTNFKKYLDNPDSEIHQYVGENGISYTYDVQFDAYSTDEDGNIRNTNNTPDDNADLSTGPDRNAIFNMMGVETSGGAINFSEILPESDGNGISGVIKDNYELLAGDWSTSHDEVLLVLGINNELSTTRLYQLGLITEDEFNDIADEISDGNNPDINWSIEDAIGKTFNIVTYSDYYDVNPNIANSDNINYVKSEPNSQEELEELIKDTLEVKISGVIKPNVDASNYILTTNIAYTTDLRDYVVNHTNDSEVVKAQESDRDINILTGISFEILSDEEKAVNIVSYIEGLPVSEKVSIYQIMVMSMPPEAMAQMPTPTSEEEMAGTLDYMLSTSDDIEMLASLFDSFIGDTDINDNLFAFGKVSYDAPTSISIYTDSFEAKDGISLSIENYNSTVSEDEEIVYTDLVAILTSSLTSIINMISYVLIAFVSVSLIVSCIMIGIITHISVLERTKEIGILRAIGASKSNVSQVFNAETLIIGLCAGVLGVSISSLLTIPINSVIHAITNNPMVNATLPLGSAIILVIISVFITVIAGFSSAKSASKKDPVTALRTD
ncbi:MAG: ABC transporter ATP-binding protein/permease, partial [bacterium]